MWSSTCQTEESFIQKSSSGRVFNVDFVSILKAMLTAIAFLTKAQPYAFKFKFVGRFCICRVVLIISLPAVNLATKGPKTQ